MSPDEQGHYFLEGMGVKLGIWEGLYQNVTLPWLRWWDDKNNLLLTGDERAELEHRKREQLADKLRNLSPEQLVALGIDPELLQ